LNLFYQLQLFHQIIDHLADELLLIRSDGQLVYVNDAAIRGLGYSREILLAQNIISFYKEKMTPRQWQEKYFHQLKKKRKPAVYQIQRIVKGGRIQAIQVTAVYMRFQGEEYVLSVGRDISEKLEMEISLKESQDRYRLLSEGAADGIFTVDLNGRVTYANRALAQLMGLTLPEAMGTHFKNYVTKPSLPKAFACFAMAKSGHARIREEIEIIGRNREIIPVEVSVSPLYQSKKVVAIHAIVRDIRKRRRLENLLIESEKKYKDLFEDANDALIIADLKGVILDANRQAENLFKKSKLAMIGTLQEALFSKNQVVFYRQLFKESLLGKSKPYDLEIIRNDGKTFPVAVLGRRVKVAEQDVFLGRFTDLSERLKNEEQIRESNKMAALNLFISGMGQEIKYPLEVIFNHLENMVGKYKGRNFEYIGFKEFKDIMMTIQNIRNEVSHCCAITDRLLTFNKRRVGMKRRGCQVNEVLKNALGFFAQEFKKTNVKVVSKLTANLPPAAIESVELEDVATCILENSLQAMPTGGKITLVSSFKKEEGRVVIEFRDEGVGIPKENLERIFEPFFTTKQASSNQSAGLGLSIVYSLVKECKGDITIKSSLGQGTQVKISLPAFKNHNHTRKE